MAFDALAQFHYRAGDVAQRRRHFAGYVSGAVVGGVISLVAGGTWMLGIATVVCVLATGYTYGYVDRRGMWQ